MFKHEKLLFHPVEIEKPNPQYAALLQEQLGGANNTNITKDTINKENIYRYSGIYRYATVGDMQKANNDYSDFKSENWSVVDGVITWKA